MDQHHLVAIENKHMNSTTSIATIEVLGHLFSSYGIPEEQVSDSGPQFVSEEFVSFLKKNGVKHTRCSPYHAFFHIKIYHKNCFRKKHQT